MENNSLLNIHSSYTIKQIFSYIEYNRFISLIKYNKEYQQKLGFYLKDNIHYNKNIEKKTKIHLATDWGDGLGLMAAIPLFGLHYLYFIIHYILNRAVDIQLNNEGKSNEFFWSIINGVIIKKLLPLIIYIGSIHVFYHTIDHRRFDYINTKKVYIILLLLIMFIHFCYELLLIKKIRIIFSFALNGKWIIVFDVIYLLANISFIFWTWKAFIQYKDCKEYSNYEYYNYLTMFKDIKIKNYELPEHFDSIENKREYMQSKVSYFEIHYSFFDLDLIEAINNYRKKNNLNELIIDSKIPNFIIKGSTEIILSPNNIIKLSNTKYVIKLDKEDYFEKIQENKNIINILLKPFLDKISIIQQRDNRYLIVYEEFDNKNYEIVQIKYNQENGNIY